MICELTGIYIPNSELSAHSLFPAGIMSIDLFDTFGTLIEVATKADMLDEEGHIILACNFIFTTVYIYSIICNSTSVDFCGIFNV